MDVSQERGRRCENFPELRAEIHANALRRQKFPLTANDLNFSTAGFFAGRAIARQCDQAV